jgi:methylated-DNA-[protein]-cysteine S-methyltransferase
MSAGYTQIESPLGALLLAANERGLKRIEFVNGKRPAGQGLGESARIARRNTTPTSTREASIIEQAIGQLRAYFAGELETFDLPLAPDGTPFQQKVWQRLCDIPYGETISYGELARRVGNPKASRAVGLANGANPIPIVIPCHRVIGSNGRLTGYGGGLPLKEKLLALERRQLRLL